jgi:hypothetical protein
MENTPNIELKTAQNLEIKTANGEFKRLYVSIKTDKEAVDSVVAYANIIGMEPDKLFEKALHSGIKSLRNSMQGIGYTSIPELIARFAPANTPDVVQPLEEPKQTEMSEGAQ